MQDCGSICQFNYFEDDLTIFIKFLNTNSCAAILLLGLRAAEEMLLQVWKN